MKIDLSELFSYLKLDNDIKHLKDIRLLHKFSLNELKSISKFLLKREYKAGEIIFRENYPHVVLYFIVDGEVSIYLEKEDQQIPVVTLGKGDHFGEIGLFTEVNRTATAQAVQDTTVFALSKHDFKRFIVKNSGSGVKLLYKLAQGLTERVIEHTYKQKNES